MSNACWLGMGLFCLAIGVMVVGVVLLVLLIVQLLKPGRSAGPAEQVVEGEAKPAAADVAAAPPELPEPAQEIVPEVVTPLESASEGQAEPPGPPPGQWDWPRVFAYLVGQCDRHGGYYELAPQEVAHLKRGAVGKNWGQPHLSDNVLPRFGPLYPDYRFAAWDPRVIKCTRG